MLGRDCSVTIVTYNSARFIRNCLTCLLEAHPEGLPIIVVDNASSDNSAAIAEEFEPRIHLVRNRSNNGFAGGQNQAIALTHTPWVLVLNPDVRVMPDFLPRLLEAGALSSRIGTVCGKLLAFSSNFEIPPSPASLDSTGLYFTPELRHFDRGSQSLDHGQFARREAVFGATGAAALYRRSMIDDISLEGEFFDADFFAYREDADVSWRAQLLGWTTCYVPDAVAYHVRTVLPTNRSSLPAAVNFHSVKNRFLMRIKNIDASLYRRHWFAITVRDCLVLAGCLVREWSSLPAFFYVVRTWRRTWRKRIAIQSRRRIPASSLEPWFEREQPVRPCPPVTED